MIRMKSHFWWKCCNKIIIIYYYKKYSYMGLRKNNVKIVCCIVNRTWITEVKRTCTNYCANHTYVLLTFLTDPKPPFPSDSRTSKSFLSLLE